MTVPTTHPTGLESGLTRAMAGGIATAAASVREVAPPAPVALALTELDDQLGALEVTFSALNERLRPVMRDDSNDTAPSSHPVAHVHGVAEDAGEVLRRVDRATRAVNSLTRDLERALSRLEV